MTKRRLYKVAKEASVHAGSYAYTGRKDKKSQNRKLWIIRINGALSEKNVSYSKFIKSLKEKNIGLDRKILAEIIQDDPETFQKILNETIH